MSFSTVWTMPNDERDVKFAVMYGRAKLLCECGAEVDVCLDDSTNETLVLVECPGCHRKWYVQGFYTAHQAATLEVTSRSER